MLNTLADQSTITESVEYHRDTRSPLLALLNLRNSVIGYSLEAIQQCKITRIECFRFDRELTEKLHPGRGNDDFCGLLAVATNSGAVGFGEFAFPCKNLHGDLVMWATPFQRMKGQSLLESFNYVQNKHETWGPVRSELIASALLNLNGQLERAAADIKDQQHLWDRDYLLRHTQAYVSF